MYFQKIDLIKQVSLLHESLQKYDEDVGFGGGHGPGSITFKREREMSVLTVNNTPTNSRV